MYYCQEHRRYSDIPFTHVDPHRFSHVVDEDRHFKDLAKFINESDNIKSHELKLSGEPTLDAEIVSKWVRKCYGDTNQAYYEAYNREIFRQMGLIPTTYIDKSDS